MTQTPVSLLVLAVLVQELPRFCHGGRSGAFHTLYHLIAGRPLERPPPNFPSANSA